MRWRSGVMAKLLIGVEGIAANSKSIVLRSELPVNLTWKIRRVAYHYRVSGLVQSALCKALHKADQPPQHIRS
jgi:hypothetical protein